MAPREYFFRFDTMKFIAACLVVLIHASAYHYHNGTGTMRNYYWYRYALEIAVPIFFAASGFLFRNKTVRQLLDYALRIFGLYVAATLLYLSFEVVKVFTDSHFLGKDLKESAYALTNSWTMSSFVKGNIGQVQLWYLAASAIAALLIAFCIKRRLSPTSIWIISTGIYVASLTNFIDFSSIAVYGGFPRAFFYTALGYFVYQTKIQSHASQLVLAVIALTIFSALKIVGAGNVYEVFMAISILSLSAWASTPLAPSNFISRLSKYALSIFILHMVFLTTITRVLQYQGLELDPIRESVLYPFVLTVLVVLLCIVAHKPFTLLVLNPVQRGVTTLISSFSSSIPRPSTSDQSS